MKDEEDFFLNLDVYAMHIMQKGFNLIKFFEIFH